MVWNTAQTAFYKAVDDYNESVDRRKDSARNYTESAGEKPLENHAEIHSENSCGSNSRGSRDTRGNSGLFSILQGGNFDSDFLLIAGLIFLLLKEKVDKKLILALAVLLLG